MKRHIFYAIAGMFVFTGCSYIPEAPTGVSELYQPTKFGTLSPMPQFLRDIPEGQDSFSQGWRDGCNSYMAFSGSGMLQLRTFTYDVNRSLRDRQYAAGFREGANICMYYTDTRPN